MEIDKLKKWLDIAQQFQTDRFWNQIFDENGQITTSNNPTRNPLSTVKDTLPKCDLFEFENVLVVEMEVPGLGKEDLHLSIQQQLLTIAGEFKTLQQNRKYFLKERVNRKFKKEVTLPFPVILNEVRTEIRNGVLIIIMPIDIEQVENIPITLNEANE